MRLPALALAAVWLAGCAFAPGLSVGRGVEKTSTQSATTSAGSGQTPPPGALLAITPELIGRQRVLQRAALGNDV